METPRKTESKIPYDKKRSKGTPPAVEVNKVKGVRRTNNVPSAGGEQQKFGKGWPCDPHDLLPYIEENVIGKDKIFSSGPFGQRSILYCDYTASGRSLAFIEDYIRNEVLPEYGNTHTTTTTTSLQTTLFRHNAREIIRNSVHASEYDSVIFTGHGCTGAIHKLINGLTFKKPPVVFVGPYEHHSNLLPWKEIGADVIRIHATEKGLIDMDCLTSELKRMKSSKRELIGSFSAASNVTGILTDVNAFTVCLHRHGALAFWDYASAGPYVNIDMNPIIMSEDQPYVYKDAVYLSPHKFVGGVGTPGILIAKKKLFRNEIPNGLGGGTVLYVSRSGHRYLQEIEDREEGGTPAIVESIRAGLVFHLKEAVTPDHIMDTEEAFCKKAFEKWSCMNRLVILGNASVARLPIFSFMIKHSESGLYLHHNFVSALLNDMFGIQARGGCACAGPYAMDLLGIDEATGMKLEKLLQEDRMHDRSHRRKQPDHTDREIIKPGFCRLNLPFFMSEEDVDFVIEAVKMIAECGWKLLPQYVYNPETVEWKHSKHQGIKDRKSLIHITYNTGKMSYKQPVAQINGPLPASRKDCLNVARKIFDEAHTEQVDTLTDEPILFDLEAAEIRWFLLPSEAQLWLTKPQLARQKPAHQVPFHPGKAVEHIRLFNDRDRHGTGTRSSTCTLV